MLLINSSKSDNPPVKGMGLAREGAQLPDLGPMLQAFRKLHEPYHSGESVLLLNLATNNPSKEGLATTLGLLQPSTEVLNIASLLGTKAFLASDGNCVIGRRFENDIADYAEYAEEHGLVTPGAMKRVTFVDDPNNLGLVFHQLAEEFKKVVLYIETAKAHELADECGVPVVGNGKEVARNVVDFLSDKANFRDVAAEICGPDLFPYPRITFRAGEELHESRQLLREQRLEDAVYYYGGRLPEGERNVLFVQAVTCAGGVGNRFVTQNEDGTLVFNDFDNKRHVFEPGDEQIHELFKHFNESEIDIEVTPYLPLHSSNSYSIMIGGQGNGNVAVALHKGQMLDPETKNYRGTIIDINNPALKTPLAREELRVVSSVINHIRELGFEGYCDVDTMQYRDRDNTVKVSLSEANMRLDAPSFLFTVLGRNPELSEKLAQNKLSLLLDDHQDVGSLGSTTAVRASLSEYGIPLASDKNPFGVYIMTPPMMRKGGREVSIGILAETDREKYELYAGIKAALSASQEKLADENSAADEDRRELHGSQ